MCKAGWVASLLVHYLLLSVQAVENTEMPHCLCGEHCKSSVALLERQSPISSALDRCLLCAVAGTARKVSTHTVWRQVVLNTEATFICRLQLSLLGTSGIGPVLVDKVSHPGESVPIWTGHLKTRCCGE